MFPFDDVIMEQEHATSHYVNASMSRAIYPFYNLVNFAYHSLAMANQGKRF